MVTRSWVEVEALVEKPGEIFTPTCKEIFNSASL